MKTRLFATALFLCLLLLPLQLFADDTLECISGDLALTFHQGSGGIRITRLQDLGKDRNLLAALCRPLFVLVVCDQDGKETHVPSTDGWERVGMEATDGGALLRWEGYPGADLSAFTVEVRLYARPEESAWEWHIATAGALNTTRLEDVVFPQITLHESICDGGILYPDGPGALIQYHWDTDMQKWQRYGGGWGSMQFMSTFSRWSPEQNQSGFYFAMHDPQGSAKEIVAQSKAKERTVSLFFEHPIPDTTRTNNYSLPGKAVWRLFRGDWFDAAQYYKNWVQKNALWMPRLGREGREDTPLWMRELCVWAQTGGTPEEVTERVKSFADYLDVPVGFHWYNWHEIPFDNDYPHYFPAKEGFAEAVQALQAANVYVMPYINGRLWDTHDCGAEDCSFTSLALPAVTKEEDGAPYIEKYGSRESDGSEVALGVMCPATPLWQNKVKEIVLRLQKECGVKGVYIDQIAAATPALCMDPSHGHPLAGGSWWNLSYWNMLDRIRREMPEGHVITTECNGEPYINRFDGYLSWHWQTDGQLPVFPAIYGGTIQCFGRSYGGGETASLALRMKAAQQLVFGEQIGWINPDLAIAEENAAFFKQIVQLRWLLRRYFYAGEMLRPPVTGGTIPQVRADWQWHGEHPVITDALLTGAWQIAGETRTALLFANVSDEPIEAPIVLRNTGTDGASLARTVLTDKSTAPVPDCITSGEPVMITLPPRKALAWEFGEAIRYSPH